MDTCLFCRIIRKELPAQVVYEDDAAIVIRDITPQAPTHLLAIPRIHYSGIHEVPSGENGYFERLLRTVAAVVDKERLQDKGYRLVVNYGEKAGQTVPHIHIHILSGRQMTWPPG
jgi:histidine triad (HIT) family protein